VPRNTAIVLEIGRGRSDNSSSPGAIARIVSEGMSMRAKDLMQTDVLTLREDDPVDAAVDRLVDHHLHGAPVINAAGEVVGIVSPWDLYFATMTKAEDSGAGAADGPLRVRDIMTSPPVSATEETEIADLCEMMYRLRIHRIPIVRGGKLAGIVGSLDVCRAVALRQKVGRGEGGE
jgi:CBS domain-containing protein